VAESGHFLFDEEDCTMLKLEGSARVETATLLLQELSQSSIAHDMAIDWEQAEHVDACVLQVLLALRKMLADRGLSLTVDKDNSHVRGYLELSGLSQYFPKRVRQDARSSEAADA
jgi:anti-anti-sigma factor